MKNIFFLMMVALVIAGCSKDKTIIEKEPIKLNQQNIVINYQEDIKVLLSSGDIRDCSYSIEDEYIVRVLFLMDGFYITGDHVGETNIYISDGNSTATLNVKVKPTKTAIATPFLDYNIPSGKIKEYMSDKNVKRSTTNKYGDIFYKYDNQIDIYIPEYKSIMSYVRYTDESINSLEEKYKLHLNEIYNYLNESYEIYESFTSHKKVRYKYSYNRPNKDYAAFLLEYTGGSSNIKYPEVYIIYSNSEKNIQNLIDELKHEECYVYPTDRRFQLDIY